MQLHGKPPSLLLRDWRLTLFQHDDLAIVAPTVCAGLANVTQVGAPFRARHADVKMRGISRRSRHRRRKQTANRRQTLHSKLPGITCSLREISPPFCDISKEQKTEQTCIECHSAVTTIPFRPTLCVLQKRSVPKEKVNLLASP